MVKQTVSPNNFWSNLIIEELIRQGCNYFCISPGSRSTPLTASVAKNAKAISKIFYDERGAAFHALGYGRASQKPAVLICTSGTAVANYFPAIIEAKQDGIPLLILTADRPPELKDTGANQTIDQVKIFADYLNWYFEFPVPETKINPQFVLTTVDQAFFKSMDSAKGPVQINCMFREPFLAEDEFTVTELINKWKMSDKPFTEYSSSSIEIPPDTEIAKIINNSKQGIILAGKMDNPSDSDAVLRLAKKTGFPVFPDITSGLRLGRKSDSIVEYYDLLLLSERFKNIVKPDLIIQFGKRFVSKRLLNFIQKMQPDNYLVIDESADRYDPLHTVTKRIVSNISQFCKSTIKTINRITDQSWTKDLYNANQKINNLINQEFSNDILSEISIARIVSEIIPANSGLFLASSMPIRDMDMFANISQPNIKVGANRGASGIDGTIACAIGFAAGINSPVTLMIGDLAFLHDLNSLQQNVSSKYPIFIILLNNYGGGIFSFLPISKQKDVFERYFATPHNLTFKKAAELFKLNYYSSETAKQFHANYHKAIKDGESCILEIGIDRTDNYALHQEIFDKVSSLLET